MASPLRPARTIAIALRKRLRAPAASNKPGQLLDEQAFSSRKPALVVWNLPGKSGPGSSAEISLLVARQFATNRRAIRGTRRIMVAPPIDMFVPLRLDGPHHGRAGEDTDVVATRAEAFRQLGLRSPAFEPVAPI